MAFWSRRTTCVVHEGGSLSASAALAAAGTITYTRFSRSSENRCAGIDESQPVKAAL